MTFSTFLFTYVLGGLTFIPLLLVAIFVPAWRSLPQVEDGIREGGGDEKTKDTAEKDGVSSAAVDEKGEGSASGTFAVLRRYDFQAAIAALNMRNNTGTGAGAGTVDGTGEVNSTSESVYQSMYRSVFDRNKTTALNTSIMANDDVLNATATVRARKAITPVNIFYIVLRHGHLMLYDSAAQLEVRHVISLAHHTISVSSGEGDQETDIKDGDFFIKRTAIVLTPTSTVDFPNGEGGHIQPSVPKKPFYLFASTCIEKEDFYHALLSTRSSPPIPKPLDTDGIIKLQSTLHSTNSLTPETRALNAILSRLFLAMHQTDRLKTIVRNKIEKKISRVQKPAFIATLAVQSIDLGDAAPTITNPRLKDLNISGDMTIAFDLRYTGGIKVTVSALAKLDLGPRFKTRTADLLLSTSLSRLQGHVLVRIKPPPTNRLWFCFESMPEMDIKVEPVVQSRQITYTFILRAIEDRIRSVVSETLLKPNWDDVAFFDTRGKSVRGGIWLQDEEIAEEKPAGELLKESNEKTRSMPSVLDSGVVDGDSSAASSGSETPSRIPSLSSAAKEAPSELKRRSVASLPAERESQTPPTPPSKHLRSPSLVSPAASVASVQLDESAANSEPVRSESQPQLPQLKKWRMRPAAQQQTVRKGAMETMREMRDRSILDRDAEDDGDGATMSEPADLEDSEPSLADRSLRLPKRTQTNISTTSSSSSTTARTQRQQEAMQKGKNLLAATAAATNAARTWSWNAIQNRSKGSRTAIGQPQQEPLGRGQPLPPPGVPLPGPQKGWLPAAVGVGSVKRKPVPPLPPRASTLQTQEASESTAEQSKTVVAENDEVEANDDLIGDETELIASAASDEFGPWRENSGAGLEGFENDVSGEVTGPDSAESERSEGEADLSITEPGSSSQFASIDPLGEVVETPVKKMPPPLPARPRPRTEEHGEDPVETNDEIRTLETVQTEDEQILASVLATEDSRKPDSLQQLPANGEDVNDQDSESEADNRIIQADTDLLVAIPAPVDENADENELEADGVQEASEIENSGEEMIHSDEYLDSSNMKNTDESSASSTTEATTVLRASDGE